MPRLRSAAVVGPVATPLLEELVVRRPDGSINQDHYAWLARELRAEQMRSILAVMPTVARSGSDWLAGALGHLPRSGLARRGSAGGKT